jgi:hypothetical protein
VPLTVETYETCNVPMRYLTPKKSRIALSACRYPITPGSASQKAAVGPRRSHLIQQAKAPNGPSGGDVLEAGVYDDKTPSPQEQVYPEWPPIPVGNECRRRKFSVSGTRWGWRRSIIREEKRHPTETGNRKRESTSASDPITFVASSGASEKWQTPGRLTFLCYSPARRHCPIPQCYE